MGTRFLKSRSIAAALLAVVVAPCLQASEPAQAPLSLRGKGVDPNLVLIFDDSNSMDKGFIYTDRRPLLWSVPKSEDISTDQKPSTDDFARCAPKVNRLAYDPAKRYRPPLVWNYNLSPPGYSSAAQGDVNDALVNAPCRTPTHYFIVYDYLGVGDGSDANVPNRRYANEAAYNKLIVDNSRSYPKSSQRTDCLGTTCSYYDEVYNYANWFAYYRSRLDAARSSLSLAFAAAPDTLRFGWTSINALTKGAAPQKLHSGVAPLDAYTRYRFGNWLNSMVLQQDTPNIGALDRVGKYFMRNDDHGPWADNPYYDYGFIEWPGATKNSSHASCRRSYAMLVTDGMYTDAISGVGNVDGTSLPAYQGKEIYSPSGKKFLYQALTPYRDSHSNTLADVAMKYWSSDLRNDLDNKVEPIVGGDPAFWQHLNFMAITLGLRGTLPQTPAQLASLASGAAAWPAPSINSPEAIDDTWHATVNGRGQLINVTNSDELTTALGSLLAGIGKTSASQAGISLSNISIKEDLKKFVPMYTSGQWTGNLVANSLDAAGNEEGILWQVESTDPATGLEASNTLGHYSTRNIRLGVGPTAYYFGDTTVPFTYENIAPYHLAAMMGAPATRELINYLRGDRTYETGDNALFRPRAFVLGDIVNSSPVFVRRAIDYGYQRISSAGASSYDAFLKTKAGRAVGSVFVGANDGMLHAFAGDTGREVMAYIPLAILPNIHLLAQKNYTHRYFVDGPIIQTDFYNGSKWVNAVIGTAGAGAKSVFALDATDPLNPRVLWERDNWYYGSDFSEMGNVLSEVRVGPLTDGTWVAVFGNGPHSASGKAQLFVVNMATGELIKRIEAGSATGNGLGGVRLVTNTNNEILGAYAGDLKGNLWRFDLYHADRTKWSARTIFTIHPGWVQSYTASPYVVAHPDGGMLVVAGSGRYFDAADADPIATQTVVGVRDTATFAVTPVGSPSPVLTTINGVLNMVQQSLQPALTVTRSVTAFDDRTSDVVVTYYALSSNPVDWSKKNGWYFHLMLPGQRNVYPVEYFFGKLAKIDTIVPGAQGTDPCAASSPGQGYNYVIDVMTGGSPQFPMLDTNGDGLVDARDKVGASGYSTSMDGRDQTLAKGSAEAGRYPGTIGVPGLAGIVPDPPGSGGAGGADASLTGGTPGTTNLCIFDTSGSCGKVAIDNCAAGWKSCATPPGPPGVTPPGGVHTFKRRSWRQLFLR